MCNGRRTRFPLRYVDAVRMNISTVLDILYGTVQIIQDSPNLFLYLRK